MAVFMERLNLKKLLWELPVLMSPSSAYSISSLMSDGAGPSRKRLFQALLTAHTFRLCIMFSSYFSGWLSDRKCLLLHQKRQKQTGHLFQVNTTGVTGVTRVTKSYYLTEGWTEHMYITNHWWGFDSLPRGLVSDLVLPETSARACGRMWMT